eukprot:g3880.t1
MYFGRSRNLQYKFNASTYIGLEFVGQHRTLLTSKRSIAMLDSRSEICEFSKSFKTDLKTRCIHVRETYMVINESDDLVVVRPSEDDTKTILQDAFSAERVPRCVGNDLVVVTRTNGTIDLLRVDSSSVTPVATFSPSKKIRAVVSAGSFRVGSKGYLAVVSSATKKSSHCISVYEITKTSVNLVSSEFTFKVSGTLERVAFHTDSESLVIFTCFHDFNTCTTFRVRDDSIHEISKQTHENVIDIMGLDEMLLVVCETSMSLWSTRFGVMLETDVATKDHSVTCLSRSYAGTKIGYVLDNNAIVIRSLQISPPSLANVLGKQVRTDTKTNSIDTDTNTIVISNNKENKLTLTENRSCIELMKRIENETSATKRLRIFKKSFETIFSNSTRFVNTIISCSLSSKIWEPIEILLQTKGLVSSSSCPELLESMLVNERLDLVKLALKHIHDLTERDLVRVLCYVLREASETCLCDYYHEERKRREEKKQQVGSKRRNGQSSKRDRKKRKKSKDSSSGTTAATSAQIALKAVAQFVRIVMSSSYDVVFMRDAIKVLSISEVLLLLRMVLKWLEKDCRGDNVATRMIEILVDAHFMALRLASTQSKDTSKLLARINEIVQMRVDMCESIAPLSGHVLQLKRGSGASTVKPDYSIETISV